MVASGCTRAGNVTGQVRSGQVRSGQVRSGQVRFITRPKSRTMRATSHLQGIVILESNNYARIFEMLQQSQPQISQSRRRRPRGCAELPFWRCMPCVPYHETQLCVGGVAGGCNTGLQWSISRIKNKARFTYEERTKCALPGQAGVSQPRPAAPQTRTCAHDRVRRTYAPGNGNHAIGRWRSLS